MIMLADYKETLQETNFDASRSWFMLVLALQKKG